MPSVFPRHLLQRSFASSCLDIVKMKAFVPCEVEEPKTHFKCTIAEIVFDPLQIEKVNDKFRTAGYIFDEGLRVIAVCDDGVILLWGGFNSVYHLRKGEQIVGAFQNLAFEDLLDLTQRFKIKNKKPEIDALIAALKQAYSQG